MFAAVEVVDLDVLAQLLSSSVSALHEAIAVTDNCGNSHAAEEAQLGLAVLRDGVTSQITCLLLLEGDAVAVCGDAVGADIALRHVDGDELDIGISVCFGDVVLAVIAHVGRDGAPASLIEALVIDGAGIAGQSDLYDLASSLRAGCRCSGRGCSSRRSGAGGRGRTAASGQSSSSGSGTSHSHKVTTRNHHK